MKKRIYSLMLLAFCSVSLFTVTSCGDDDDNEPKTSKSYCTCTAKKDGVTETDKVYLSEWGADDCNDLRHILASSHPGISYSCN